MAERSTPVRSVVGVNCVVTCGVGVAWVCLVGSVCALISAPGCVFCASTVTDWGAACTVTPLPIPYPGGRQDRTASGRAGRGGGAAVLRGMSRFNHASTVNEEVHGDGTGRR